MKQFKKVLALALALALALSLSMPVFATEGEPPETPEEPTSSALPTPIAGSTIKIDLPAKPGDKDAEQKEDLEDEWDSHTFVAYPIFTATQASVGSELGDIKWAEDFSSAAFWNALTESELGGQFEDVTAYETDPDANARGVAAVVATWVDADGAATADAYTFAALANQYVGGDGYANGTELDPGYYLVVDSVVEGETVTVYNLSTLTMNTSGSFTPNIKVDVPELEKKVLQSTDSMPGESWQDAADYDIEDHVTFALTGTLPNDYANYETYKYAFHDTLSGGLAFTEGDTYTVLLRNGDAEPADITNSFELSEGSEGDTFALTCDDLKSIPGVTITSSSFIQVIYTATLTNVNVIYGAPGNLNSAYLEFSNNPSYIGDGDNEPTGNTPPDTAIVFTFKLNASKVDPDGEALYGAEFQLYKAYAEQIQDEDGNAVPADLEENQLYYYLVGEIKDVDKNNNEFEFKGLDSGKYMLRETVAPAGYNRIDDVYFEVVAVVSNEDGTGVVESLEVTGLDENFEITAPNRADGTLLTDVVNQKGVTLPSTGGIGTTIFYMVGGLLVVAAVVLLITKKRMGKAE